MLALNRSATLATWPFRNSPWHLGQDNLLTSADNLTLQCRDYDTYRYTVILTLGLWQQITSLRLVPKVITVTMIRVIYPHHNANRRWRASVSNLRWKMTHWKRYRVTDAGHKRRHTLSLTDTDCVGVNSADNLTLQCRDYDTYRYTVILTLGLWQQITSLRLVPKVITVTMIRVIYPHHASYRIRWWPTENGI